MSAVPILPPPDAPADWRLAPGVIGAPEPLSAEEVARALSECDADFFEPDPDC